jgi:hypothetical protein
VTTRVQIIRSSTPGAVPAAGTRSPGELWTTFPDLQLGVIDATKTAQRLVAVRYFSASANYAVGDFVIQSGVLYAAKVAVTAGAFNATQWTQIGAATDAGGPYLAIAGGTLTGALVLNADPGAALGAATKQYVDGKVTAAPFLPLAGGTLTGPVTLSGPPIIPLHAATKAYVDSGAFVPIAGGTMTGPLVLAANPAAPLQPATKQYVDALPVAMNDNRVINGDMRRDARNNGASGTANAYTVDRWRYYSSQAAKGTWQQAINQASDIATTGFGCALNFRSSSAYTPLATDYFGFLQAIEADQIGDFAWGTASARPVTLSFWAYCTLTGAFSGVVQNYATTRSYPFTYSIPVTNTWTRIAITIPGDTAGTWVLQGNGGALDLLFDLGSGATYRAPAGAWASGNFLGANGAASLVATNGASLFLTGVKLEIGSVATPFNRQSLAESMADCQRYYQIVSTTMRVLATGAGNYGCTVNFQTMRASPTSGGTLTTGGNANISAANIYVNSSNSARFEITSQGSGDAYAIAYAYPLSAEL